MYSISMIKNIKNLFPYFLLVSIYFFFVNLEARKDDDENRTIKKVNLQPVNNDNFSNNNSRIKIPVIPYNQ